MNNYKTTIGGTVAAIGLAGSQVPGVPDKYRWIFDVMSASGMILLGITAKDYNTHSTATEVEKSTQEKKG